LQRLQIPPIIFSPQDTLSVRSRGKDVIQKVRIL
jgi:hypothetical protein